jgi:hypothetical protein
MSYVLAGWVFSFVVLIGFDKFVLKNQFTKKTVYTNLFLAALASSVVYFVLAIVGG